MFTGLYIANVKSRYQAASDHAARGEYEDALRIVREAETSARWAMGHSTGVAYSYDAVILVAWFTSYKTYAMVWQRRLRARCLRQVPAAFRATSHWRAANDRKPRRRARRASAAP
jgi:hypothetical protein